MADTSEIDIQGSLSQSNTLILNFANATTQPSAVSYTAQGTTQGSIYIDNGNNPSLTINYGLFTSNADSIIDEIATAVRDFSFTDNGINPETITLAAGSTSGTMTLQSNNALPVTFLDPSSSLSVDEDGILADTVAIGSVDPSFSGQLTVIGGDETVDVEPSVFNGPLIVNAGGGTNSTVNIEPSTLSVAGKAAFLATSVAVDSTSITSTGDQVYGGAVTLDTSPITISSTGGNVTFNGTVDGASNLTVNAAAATFYDPVGSLSELKSLTLNAGTVNVDSTVSTTVQTITDPTPSSLSGYVYVDANDNGTFDTGETPLSGVGITLTGTNDLGDAVSLTATTAADGSYSFIDLRPGLVHVDRNPAVQLPQRHQFHRQPGRNARQRDDCGHCLDLRHDRHGK